MEFKGYTIKFAYRPTVKSGIIDKMVELEESLDKDGAEGIEKMLEFLPEMLLVGLQYEHRDEFGYDYDTKDGKEEALDKVYELIEDYFDNDKDANFQTIFENLQKEMVENSFLARVFQAEAEVETEVVEQKKTTTKKTTAKK